MVKKKKVREVYKHIIILNEEEAVKYVYDWYNWWRHKTPYILAKRLKVEEK